MQAIVHDLPVTLYRQHAVDCTKPGNAFAFDFMSDYLTMMDILAKSITHELGRSCQLTPLQYRILWRLLGERALTASELAANLHMRASTISVAVSKLVERDAVARSEDITDMRTVFLHLTKTGHRLIQCADEAVFATMQQYWRSLTPEQFDAASESSIYAAEHHSQLRFDDGQLRLDTALVDTVMISRRLTSHALQAHGLATTDFRVMLALRIMGRSDMTANVAQFLFLNSSDITSSLRNLDARGYLDRSRSAANRRIRSLMLTDAGDAELVRLMPVVFDALHETCHSNDDLIRTHISAARDLVARRRHRNDF